jgi:hypothetical protein
MALAALVSVPPFNSVSNLTCRLLNGPNSIVTFTGSTILFVLDYYRILYELLNDSYKNTNSGLTVLNRIRHTLITDTNRAENANGTKL